MNSEKNLSKKIKIKLIRGVEMSVKIYLDETGYNQYLNKISELHIHWKITIFKK